MHILSCRRLPLRLAVAGLAFAALSLAAAPAHAQNLVQDGGFEQADTASGSYSLQAPFDADWTVTQGTVSFFTPSFFPQYIFDGSSSLYLTPSSSGVSQITQALKTTPGERYLLSFYANDFLGSSNLLNVGFGDTVVGGGPLGLASGTTASDYTFYQFTVQADSPLTALMFSAADDYKNTITLDDISVTPAAVPEASTTASFGLLLALGLGGLAVAAKKKAGTSAA